MGNEIRRDAALPRPGPCLLSLDQSELKALFAAMNDAVLVLDAEEGRCLKIVSANPRLLYDPPDEQLGKTLHEVFPAKQADTCLGWIRHHEVFDPAMNASAFQRLEVGNDLRRAVERNEFRVYYQPKVRLPTNLQHSLRFSGRPAIVAASQTTEEPTIVGMEALVRWEHPERGLLSPAAFIPVAEESGVIVSIGRKVLGEACRQVRAWQDVYPSEEPLVMCVNISAKQFQHPELAQDVARVLQQTGLEPRSLQLEITESVVMEDAHATLDTLRKLERLGVQLAIDDFGTGYSSLSYLKRFPVNLLKIDRSFVEPLGEDPEDAVLVSGIISLAHTLGMRVVAEGVETTRQLTYLQGLGCDMAQGYYFSKPLSSEAASALLARPLPTTVRQGG